MFNVLSDNKKGIVTNCWNLLLFRLLACRHSHRQIVLVIGWAPVGWVQINDLFPNTPASSPWRDHPYSTSGQSGWHMVSVIYPCAAYFKDNHI